MHTEEYEAVGAGLSAIGFDTVLDAARTACAHAYAAWVEQPLPRNLVDMPQGRLLAPIHQGIPCSIQGAGRMRSLIDQLAALDLVRVVDDEVRAGAWQLTSYHGILAARDQAQRGEDPKVYIGEDSLHFVDWVASAPASAAALDIGAGSGISSVALARRARHVGRAHHDATFWIRLQSRFERRT